MTIVPPEFTAVLAGATGPDGDHHTGPATVGPELLMPGELTVRVLWSGINYKDALAMSPTGRVARVDPLVPGIDLVGEVLAAEDGTSYEVGDVVVAHGYGLGVSHHGGFAEIARVPSAWAFPLPAGLSPRDAMVAGTAGFTAALSVDALERQGLRPGDGPVLVTGATGGVGSVAVAMLAAAGHEVVASTGKDDEADWLRRLGATEVVPRVARSADARPLARERWAAAVDPVGGPGLAQVLSEVRYGGAVAVSGLTGGAELETTVLPFILRGVALLGIDSVACEIGRRRVVWDRIAGDLRPADWDVLARREIELAEVPDAAADLLRGTGTGRTVVRVQSS